MSISRRNLIRGAGVAAVGAAQGVPGLSSAAVGSRGHNFPPDHPNIPPIYDRCGRPDIVLIVADDAGFSDFGCYGGDIDTPHIDSLADRGMTFSNATNQAKCAPSRASILTGLYPTQAGIGEMPGVKSSMRQYQQYLRKSAMTVGEIASKQGYATAHIGKWHVGEEPGSRPHERGFDYALTSPMSRSYWDPAWKRNGEKVRLEGYNTDIVTDHAVDYIGSRAHKKDPFLLVLDYKSPHWPLQSPDEDLIAKYRERFQDGWKASRRRRLHRQDRLKLFRRPVEVSEQARLDRWEDAGNQEWESERMAVYAAQIEHLDAGVGKVLDELERRDRYHNTVVIFVSDNGGNSMDVSFRIKSDGDLYGNIEGVMPGPPNIFQSYGKNWSTVSNAPFAGHKSGLGEGGIANPLIISWPKRFARARTYHGHVNMIDLTPTIVSLVGADLTERKFRRRDGVTVQYPSGLSLVSVFDRRPSAKLRDRAVCFEYAGHRAIRTHRWKLVYTRDEQWRLYDMVNDRSESVDVARHHLRKARRLERQWRDWANWAKVGRFFRKHGKVHYVPHHW